MSPSAPALQPFEREVEGDGYSATVSREVSLKGREVFDGHECTVVEVVHNIEGRHVETLRFHFADEMAFTPVRIECFNVRGGEGVARYSYTMSDFAEVTPGIYVPAKAEYNVPARGTEKAVKMLLSMEIELPETVDQGIFELTFPEGTQVFDTISGVEYVVGESLAPREVTDPLSDPGDVTEGAQEAPAQETPDEVVPSEPPPPAEPEPAEVPRQIPSRLKSYGALLAVLVAVCCVAAVMIAKRKRRNT